MPVSADIAIIGSGPAGSMSAAALVEQGLSVVMIDPAFEAPDILSQSPGQDFPSVRRTRMDQWRWFLGENCSAIPVGGLQGGLGGGMASGNRSYVTKGTNELLPLSQDNVQVIQSLAEGGLGAAWGATSAFLDDEELTAMGLDAHTMGLHYERVARHIGVSGPDRFPFLQPALHPDHHALLLERAAKRKSKDLHKLGMQLRQPCSAVLTEPLGKRSAYDYEDLDYYADPGEAVYRPQYTIRDLSERSNFRILKGLLAEKIEEQHTGCRILCTRVPGGAREIVEAKKVILAAGAIGSARVLLRSLDLVGVPVPIQLKPHVFIPCLHTRTLGMAGPLKRLSLCQMIFVDEARTKGLEASCAQLYSYRSLLLFRLLGNTPLAAPEAFAMLSVLAPSLVIADVRFPQREDRQPVLALERSGWGDRIRISHPNRNILEDYADELKRLKKAMRTVGLMPLKTVALPEASSSHYAGTIPRHDASSPLRSLENGKVDGTSSIFVADASAFRRLTAKPHTLTLMAYADYVGLQVARELKRA